MVIRNSMARKKTAAAQKYEEEQRRNEAKIAAGLVSERFPQVSGMVIKITYYQEATDPVLMVRTINVYPTSHAYFHMSCAVKECSGGGFDLTRTIAGLVKKRKKSAQGTMSCNGGGDKLVSLHASISYEIQINYKRASK